MNSSGQIETESQRWKSRYDRLRGDFELFESKVDKRFGHVFSLIDNIRATNPYDDKAYDAALHALLDAVKNDKPATQVSVQLEAFVKRAKELAGERRDKTQQIAEKLLTVLDSFSAASSSKADLKKLKDMARRIEKAGLKGKAGEKFDVAFWLEQLATVSLSSRQVSEEHSEEKPASSILSLFKRKEDKAPEQELRESNFSSPLNVSESKAAEQERDLNTDNDSNALPEVASTEHRSTNTVLLGRQVELPVAEIAATLLALLADIEIPETARTLASELYERLEKGIATDDIIPVLDDTVDVVVQALRRDQEDFEEFLQSLDERLIFVSDFLNSLNRHLGEAPALSGQLSDDVSSQVQGIRASLNQATSIDELKQQIDSKLSTVSGLLDHYVIQQTEQNQALQLEVDTLQHTVNELELESDRTKQSLARQREKLLRDSLTGIPNREAYEVRLADEYARWRRYKRPLSFVVADIDNFKSINDKFGHAAGDKVLALIAKIMHQQLRESDFIARYGGEEFVIILPETTLYDAKKAIEKLRIVIQESPFNFSAEPVQVTCSFGLTEFLAKDNTETVFERADKALYQAKDKGRNCIVTLEQ